MRVGQDSTCESSAAAPPDAETTRSRHETGSNDEPSFTRGVTFRHILRAHELIRRFGWKHLIALR